MANIIMTTHCPSSCAFCFAGHLKKSSAPDLIDGAQFRRVLDLVERSGGQEIRLVGGEPTLHPELPEFLEEASRRNLRVTVMTNGLVPERTLGCIEQLSEQRCTVIVNLSATMGSAQSSIRLQELLTRLGSKVALGFTIDQLPYDLEPVLSLLIDRRWCLRPVLRVGMAHPVYQGANRHLHPKQYPLVGRLLATLAREATKIGVRLDFDCGFVRCQLDADAVAALNANGAHTRFECRPIVDLGPDSKARHCLALDDLLTVSLTEPVQPIPLLREELAAQRRAYDLFGVYRECSACSIRAEGGCDGGCLVARMARLESVRYPQLPEDFP